MRDDDLSSFLISVTEEIFTAIASNQSAFGLELSDGQIARLSAYYQIVQEHNPLLHLVAPCSPEEFAIRHILESLMLLKHLPQDSKIADIGAGAGLPSIPCLLVREDLKGRLIDSKEKKVRFLSEAVEPLGIASRVEVVGKQFIETHAADATHVTCRALEKFTVWMPRLVRWSRGRTMLFFGGPALGEALGKEKVRYTGELMPMSERRYLYIIKPSS
jgi:16S rRNA (guanine(527)-N(7))-methyltransferase RsmG